MIDKITINKIVMGGKEYDLPFEVEVPNSSDMTFVEICVILKVLMKMHEKQKMLEKDLAYIYSLINEKYLNTDAGDEKGE